MTVQELRDNGYRVRVLHFRDPILPFRGDLQDYTKHPKRPKGGSTRVIIDSPSGEHFEGEARCSDKENYDKKLGVRIALGRSGVLDYIHTKV